MQWTINEVPMQLKVTTERSTLGAENTEIRWSFYDINEENSAHNFWLHNQSK